MTVPEKTTMKPLLTRALAALAFLLAALVAHANPLTGTRQIVLSNANGERHVIGQVEFSDAGQGKSAFKVVMADVMQDYFLAMRPFRCLTGSWQRVCWFPVKNEEALISDDDLLPLEYALMFMRSKPKDLHMNPFNGLYYKLRRDGQRLVGKLYEVDMEPFIVPDSRPPSERKRPLKDRELSDADPVTNWLPTLSIE
jgi:hypothetical protein